ncbi:hypothetical protein EB118_12350 [bacterium]|nr:hypothetical protein [bacterium]
MARKLGISEIIKLASEQKTKQDKINILQQHSNEALLRILKYAYCPSIKFVLPEGQPPYKENAFDDCQPMLYQEVRRMYLFIEGGNNDLSKLRREQLFIGLLESLDKDDAKLLCSVKDKKLPYKGITPQLVKDAFPGLIQEK